jgi:hypothetical protein
MTNADRQQTPTRANGRVTAADVDDELLALAHEVLQRSTYAVAEVRDPELPVLIAENADNVLAIATTVTVDAAVLLEPLLSRLLIQRMSERDLDGKKWDGYVALLTSQAAPTATAAPLFGIAYDLRHVRRLVKVAVEPTLAAVERALRPVLPLPAPPSADELADPLAMLEARLKQRGVDSQAVERTFARFLATHTTHVIDEDGPTDDEDTP